MGTVTIAGRELRVLEYNETGAFMRDLEVTRIGTELQPLSGCELQMKFAEMVYAYVGALNEGVSLDWLVKNLGDVQETLRACANATGRKPKEPSPGEAVRP